MYRFFLLILLFLPSMSSSADQFYSHGVQFLKQNNYKSAGENFEKAADQGYAPAQYQLGKLYFDGVGPVQNYEEARDWFQKAAEQGNREALIYLGHLYFDGLGVKQDYNKALEWYEAADHQKNSETGRTASGSTPAEATQSRADFRKFIRDVKAYLNFINLGADFQTIPSFFARKTGRALPALTPDEVIAEIEANQAQPRLSQALVRKLGVHPIDSIQIDNKIFYLSTIFEDIDGFAFAIMYVPNQRGIFMPRYLYKSRSDGNWRCASDLKARGIQGVYISKGRGVHYTQETKLHTEIIDHLEKRSFHSSIGHKGPGAVEKLFIRLQNSKQDNERPPSERVNSFTHEAILYDDQGVLENFQDCTPGKCFGRRDLLKMGGTYTQYIDELNKNFYKAELEGFMPDFDRDPAKEYQVSHSILSVKGKGGIENQDVTVKVYLGKLRGRVVEWHMAKDRFGRVWIDRIRFADGKVTSYGTEAEIIDSGILTNKPLEYRAQAHFLKKGSEYLESKDKHYVDITPLLKNLLPIRAFIQAEHHRR